MDYAAARLNMVEGQVRPNRVTSPRVVAAMLDLPREEFVPEPLRAVAYVDEDLPLGGGRWVMEPMVLARLVQAADPQPDERALVVGCGLGYGAALLARLCAGVVALESDPMLAAAARPVLARMGEGRVGVVEGPLAAGHPGGAPYDVILIEGAVAEVPAALSDQLAEGGRLVAVRTGGDPGSIGSCGGGMGLAVRGERIGGLYVERPMFDAATPALAEFRAAPRFVF